PPCSPPLPYTTLFRSELAERNLFAGADLIDQRKISGSEHSKVLAVLLVDALDIFRDHQLDAGRHLGIGRLLAAGAFAAPLAAHRSEEHTSELQSPDHL